MKYFVAENLVFKELELELNNNIQRHMAFKSTDRFIELDGVLELNHQTIGIEVKFSKLGYLNPIVIKSLVGLVNQLQGAKLKNFKLILAFVYEDAPIRNIESFKDKLREFDVNVEVKQYNFGEMKQKFGIK